MKRLSFCTALAAALLHALMLAGCGGGGSATVAGVSDGTPPAKTEGPAAPTGVTATGGINMVTLAWNPVPDATSYNIYWSANPGVTPGTGVKITGAGSPYHHDGLLVSQTYFYVVTAVDSSGVEGPASGQAATVSASNGANLYAVYCAGCHGSIAATTIMDGTPDHIKAAIAANTGGMGTLATLTAGQIDSIAQLLPCH
ncbi:hypothetical protein FO488_05330 [Geobacter sp. FeAm09]|uniref:hypothetical protein n=1 Tax=Geobacter sp. FeAm09 TaxID=2597769 RepID=UPI0011EECB98|nr:hypothetical protein [Geobacter sp. FeAm09]QEM67631.1 hypothetical protein FO488_05330 [Geobacter sp. FeAm09]